MKTEVTVEEAKPSLPLKSVAAISIPYGFVLASCYLTGYWTPLGLNPFQYANAADLVSATIAGIWAALAVFAIGGLIGIYGNPTVTLATKVFRSRGQQGNDLSRGSRIAWAVLAILAIPLLSIALWKGDKFIRLLVVATVFFSFVVTFLAHKRFINLGEKGTIHKTMWVMFFILFMPIWTWKLGSDALEKTLDSFTGTKLDVARSALPMKTQGRVVYVGMLGEYHVAQEVDTKSTLLLPSSTTVVFQVSESQRKKFD